MTNTSSYEMNNMQQLLLMAAYVLGLGPEIEMRANCAGVVAQALKWAGLWSNAIRTEWTDGESPAEDRSWEAWYDELIVMIRHEPASDALFQGGGNFGSKSLPAAYPLYTSCRLTAAGWQIAEQLIEQHPEYKKSI